jgi:hypothetical protein
MPTILLAVLGIISLSGAVMLFLAQRRWNATAVKVTGKVIDVRRSESTSTNSDDSDDVTVTVTYQPTVRFEAEGRVVEFLSKVSTSTRREVGQDIGVHYQRGNPDDAQIEGPGVKTVMALVLGVIGLALIVLSVVVHK